MGVPLGSLRRRRPSLRVAGGAAGRRAGVALSRRERSVRSIARLPGSKARYAALLLVLFSAPLGAWAVAGLETGVVVALATAAAVLPALTRCAGAPRWQPALGSAPRCSPTQSSSRSVERGRRARTAKRATVWALSIGPWLATALLRAIMWGRPAPLAVIAKPSDVAHGLTYVVPAARVRGSSSCGVCSVGDR